MNKRLKRIIYYLIIIVLFIIFDKVIYLVPNNYENAVINNIILQENYDLKKELNEITKLEYNDYDYEIGKITYHNMYNSNSYFIEYNSKFDNNVVINDKGMIGVVNNHVLTLVKDLQLSIKIGDNDGILKDNKITIVNGNYSIGMSIYTSSYSYTNNNYLIGYVKSINSNDIESIIEIDYLDINSDYVAIIK